MPWAYASYKHHKPNKLEAVSSQLYLIIASNRSYNLEPTRSFWRLLLFFPGFYPMASFTKASIIIFFFACFTFRVSSFFPLVVRATCENYNKFSVRMASIKFYIMCMMGVVRERYWWSDGKKFGLTSTFVHFLIDVRTFEWRFKWRFCKWILLLLADFFNRSCKCFCVHISFYDIYNILIGLYV